MQVYDIQISGNSDVERINAQGDYIYYSYGSAGGSSPCVEVRGINTGFRVKLLPGQGMRLPMGKVERDWLIKPDKAIAGSLIGAVVIGEGEIFDNRVTGSVEVIDGGKNRTMANQAFIGYGYAEGGVAAYSYGQLWNPPSSGKRLIVEKLTNGIFAGGSVPAVLNVGINNGALGIVQNYGKSKLSGGSISQAEFRTETNAQTPGARFPTGLFWDQYVDSILKMWQIEPKEPFVINPGFGIFLGCSSANTGFTTNIEFYEEPV